MKQRSYINLILPLWIFSVFLSISLNARSQNCETVKISDFPPKDLPKDLSPGILKQENSYKYYYGIGVKIDYIKARNLAFIEMSTPDYTGNGFGGPVILMMIYANGYDVERNLDLSIRLACANVNGAPAEIEGRLDHLKEMKSTGSKETFDICDDLSSGFMMGVCQGIISQKASYKRNTEIDSVTKTWSRKERAEFDKLRKTANIYFDARSTSEVDLSGTARAMYEYQESDNLENAFRNHVFEVDHCDIKMTSSGDFIKSGKELDSVYSLVLNKKPFDYGTVTKDQIRQTQKKWIAYRDAWVRFGKIKCPNSNGETIKTIVTKERIEQLREFLPAK